MLPQMDDRPCLIESSSGTSSCSCSCSCSISCSINRSMSTGGGSKSMVLPVVIRAPVLIECPVTFDWSDFPVVQRDAFALVDPTSCCQAHSSSPLCQQALHHLRDNPSMDCCCSSAPGQDWISPCLSDLSIRSISSSSSNSTDTASNTSQVKSPKSSHRRRVSFSTTKHVRTHSIVLGDHPHCAQLALELGWEHNDSVMTEETGDFDTVVLNSRSSNKPALRRRSYFERKAILRDVGGMTEEEIRQTTLRHAAPSSRDLSVMQGISL